MNPSRAISIVSACLLTMAAQADDLFATKLQLNCRTLGSDKLITQKIKETDVIGAAIGSTDKNAIKNHALVYNSTANALQVVDSAGALVTNVMFFSGGAFTSDSKQSTELTFVFLPDVGDAIGSAVINEKVAKNNTGTTKDKANITGNLQLFLVGDQNLGGSGPSGGGGGDTNTNTTVTANAASTNGIVFGASGSATGPNGGSLKWFTTNSDGTITTNGMDNSTGTNGNTGGDISTPATATASPASASTSGGTFFTLASLTQSNTNVRVCTGKFTAGKRFVSGTSTNTPSTNAPISANITTPATDITDTNSVSGTNGASITTTNGITVTTTNGTFFSRTR